MMFASDLDRTLIYSKRAMEEYSLVEELELIAVERKEDKEVSFMSKKALDYLGKLSSRLMFVPVTTRSLSQYKRVSFQGIEHQYAVTTNGAIILYNGDQLREWDEKISKAIRSSSVSMGELVDLLVHQFAIDGDLRFVEERFVYYYLEKEITSDFLSELTHFAEERGWRVSLQGKKLYFVPKPLSKGSAIKYIQEREGISTVIGAGDSLLDDDFLQFCQHPFVLGHGELNRYPLKEHYNVIEQLGVKGGEELLKSIHTILESKHK
ncbi:HAD family hydrolase [Robertmurraya massiliosenegalensis]|uniref:HAD family hydrolase n=1 Tax=Robertmurraya massiliosenegalensis TaxID=1287657 RepID=UPI0002D36033|nr:HAD family hydrolase [Robertmurraya massiliosenegalensis]